MHCKERNNKNRWKQHKKLRTAMMKRFKKGRGKKQANLMIGKIGTQKVKVTQREFELSYLLIRVLFSHLIWVNHTTRLALWQNQSVWLNVISVDFVVAFTLVTIVFKIAIHYLKLSYFVYFFLETRFTTLIKKHVINRFVLYKKKVCLLYLLEFFRISLLIRVSYQS